MTKNKVIILASPFLIIAINFGIACIFGEIIGKWAFIPVNHAVFGVNSELNSGLTTIVSTFIMGLIWALVYKKTNSLRWIILAHFLVDFFNLSAASFLDLYEKGW